MKNILSGVFIVLSSFIIFTHVSYAQVGTFGSTGWNDKTGIAPCGGTETKEVDGKIVTTIDECTFDDFVQLGNNVINTLIYLTWSISVLLFGYAGFLYITNNGNESQIKKAHGIFKGVAIGFLVSILSWVAVNLVVKTLLVKEDYNQVMDEKPQL